MRFRPTTAGVAMLFFLASCFDSSTDREQAHGHAERERSSAREGGDGGGGEPPRAGDGGRSPSNYTQLRNEKRALEARVAELKKLKERQGELVKEEIEASTRLESARRYLDSLVSLEGEVEIALEGWRVQTRDSFVGVRLPQVTTIAGDTYEQVEIIGVSDSHLNVRHSGGTADLEIMQLPVSLRRNIIHEATVLATQ